ncbi:MAG: response regulator [Omnitrophica bacterium]|nr:response regulator [Candidatus Omnitrophota bacterium]
MGKKAKILVVDDEPQNIKLLEANLLPKGYEVLAASNGKEALQAVTANDIDLILLDIMMPEMDGFEVTRKIRATEATQLIPIVLVTALKETEDRIKGIDAGCDDFISKPFDKNEVLARVNTLLKLSYLRRQLNEKEKFEAVINEISDGIIVCDKNWIIREINNSARKYLNISEPEKSGLLEVILKFYSASITKEKILDFSIPRKTFELIREETKEFKALYLTANLDILKNTAGEISNIVITLRDVTGMRKEEFLKQDFLSLVSHKLRTPITGISGGVSLLQDGTLGPLNEEQKKFINDILEKAYSLENLLEKLLGFVTIERKKLDLSKEPIALQSYLPELLNPTVKKIKDKKIKLNIDCSTKDIKLNINKKHFDLIVKNLVENAIKFNDKDTKEVTVSAEKAAGEIKISVSDNGRGIPSEERDKIFEKFYQIEKYFTGNVEGAGLGLALVKRLVTAYNGKIELQSEIDKGTKIIVIIPSNREV